MHKMIQSLECRQDESLLLLKQLEKHAFDNHDQLDVLVGRVQAQHNELQEEQVRQKIVVNDLTSLVRFTNSSLCGSQQLINHVLQTISGVSEKVASEDTFKLALTALKQLCWQVPTMMYRIIFAKSFPSKSYLSKRSYSYRDLRLKLDALKDLELRREKRQLLDELVEQIGWSDDMECIIDQLLEEYELQPILKEFELDNNTVELIFTADILTSDEVSTVHKIVDVWRCLNARVK